MGRLLPSVYFLRWRRRKKTRRRSNWSDRYVQRQTQRLSVFHGGYLSRPQDDTGAAEEGISCAHDGDSSDVAAHQPGKHPAVNSGALLVVRAGCGGREHALPFAFLPPHPIRLPEPSSDDDAGLLPRTFPCSCYPTAQYCVRRKEPSWTCAAQL